MSQPYPLRRSRRKRFTSSLHRATATVLERTCKALTEGPQTPSRSRSGSVAIALYVYAIIALFAIVIGRFVIVILGRLPRGLFDLMVLANSYTARSDAYLFLLTETYPPFQDAQTRGAGGEPQAGGPALP